MQYGKDERKFCELKTIWKNRREKKMLFDSLKIGIKERQKHTPSVSSVGVETWCLNILCIHIAYVSSIA